MKERRELKVGSQMLTVNPESVGTMTVTLTVVVGQGQREAELKRKSIVTSVLYVSKPFRKMLSRRREGNG